MDTTKKEVNTMHKKSILMLILMTIPLLIALPYSLFPSSPLNQKLTTTLPFTYIYAFPLLFGCLYIAILFVCAIYAYKHKKNMRFIMMAIILMICLSVASMPFQESKTTTSQKGLRIVSYNVGNHLTYKSLDKLLKGNDVVVLCEYGQYDAQNEADFTAIKILMKQANININNYDLFMSKIVLGTADGAIGPVTVITRKSLNYQMDGSFTYSTTFGTLHLKSKHAPEIIALHTAPPLAMLKNEWQNDLQLISEKLIKKYPDAIILGDFNATMRHSSLSTIKTHKDVLNVLPFWKRGTWHTKMPWFIRSSIDHILIPSDSKVKNVSVMDLGESDHCAIYVEYSY